jgi:hypothetical protein
VPSWRAARAACGLIEFAFGNVPFLQSTPQSVLDEIARYPESTLCVGTPQVRRGSGRRVRELVQ